MNKYAFMTALATLLVGVAIGWAIKPIPAEKSAVKMRNCNSRQKRRIADSPVRVKTLTTIITNVIDSSTSNSNENAQKPPHGPRDFMADLERMKIENPEKYASTTNRFAQFRNRMIQRMESKLDTLASINTRGWSKTQIENHERYQDLILRRAELMEIVRHDSDASQEERDAAFGELRKLRRELRETSARERNTLLDKTFQELGYTGSDAREIREAVKQIYSTTEEWGGPGHMRNHPGRPRQ